MVISKGQIWWVDLGEPAGSEPGYKRPVVIISADSFNTSRIQTVTAAVITSNLNLAEAPGNIFLTQNESGLNKESVINVTQIVTIDKTNLIEMAGQLKSSIIQRLNQGLKIALDLK